MMSYDKYERGRQQLNEANGGHQRITYKKKYIYIYIYNKDKNNNYPTAHPK